MKDLFLEYAKSLKWGTYGKYGKDPLRWVTLGECDTEHLKNIIKNIKARDIDDEQLNEYIRACEAIIESRKEKLPENLFTI